MIARDSSSVAVRAVAGVVPSFLVGMHCVTAASVLFAGPLQAQLPAGITLVLLGTGLLALMMAWKSGLRTSIAFPSYIAAAILAPALMQIAERVEAPQVFPTVLAAIGVSTLGTGVVLLVIGGTGTSRVLRFVPYPIIGGFLASAGVLVARSAISVMAGSELSWGGIAAFADVEVLWRIAPGGALALVLLLCQWKGFHSAVVPAALLVAIGIGHFIAGTVGDGVEAARADGWFVSAFATSLDSVRPLFSLSGIDWPSVAAAFASLLPVVIVMQLVVLLQVTAIEVVVDQDAELDRELRTVGLGNLFAGLFGGLSGTPAASVTSLAHSMGGSGRITGFVCASVFLLFAALGGHIVPQIPVFVIGAMSLSIGLAFIKRWLFDSFRELSPPDYSVIVVIVVVTTWDGFLSGLTAGFVLASILFVVRYSRLEVVKHALSGTAVDSHVERNRDARVMWDKYGDQLFVLELEGFIFFGTAHTVYERVRTRWQDDRRLPVRMVLLDLSKVIGLDASAAVSLLKIVKLVSKREGDLLVTGLSPKIRGVLEQSRVLGAPGVRVFTDLDRGIEWCQEKILEEWLIGPPRTIDIEDQLALFLRPEQYSEFLGYLRRIELPAGTQFASQGESADRMWFLACGQVTVLGELPGGKTLRFRTFNRGTIIGELGLYTDKPRSASLCTDTDAILYELTKESFRELCGRDPILALTLHEYVVNLLAMRLRTLDQRLRAMLS